MTAHARLSPSAAEAWMTCAGYPNAVASLENRSSIYAAEGTAAHSLREKCLILGIDPHDCMGETIIADGHTFTVDKVMAGFLQPGIDRVREFAGRMTVEHRVDLSRWMPGQFGTLDCGIVGDDLIVINDLKYGQGVPVSPVENKQLRIYALGFWDNIARHHSKSTRFKIIIDQPRAAGGGGEWDTTLDELLAFGEEMRAAAWATLDPNAPRKASEKGCFWCAAKRNCAEFERFNLDIIGMKFEDLDAPCPPAFGSQLTPERKSYIARHKSMFVKFVEQIHAETLVNALSGHPTPGLKAVAGRKGAREWTDEEMAEAFLLARLSREDSFTFKLISPTQAEKIMGTRDWKDAAALITQAEPKPILVPEDDERPALQTTADKFDDLSSDETDLL